MTKNANSWRRTYSTGCSILRGKLDMDEVRTISEGLQVAIEALKRGQK